MADILSSAMPPPSKLRRTSALEKFVSQKAEDTAGPAPGKDDNALGRKFFKVEAGRV